MRRIATLLPLITLISTTVHAGNEPAPAGARAVGLGNASVTLTDAWSVANNIGALGWLDHPVVGVFAENRFGISAFRTTGITAATPFRGGKAGTVGLDIARFGDDIYSETRAGFGYAYHQGPFSIGAKADFLQIAMEGLPSRRTVALSAGGLVKLLPQLWLGAYGYNLNQAKLSDAVGQRVPTLLKAGLSYRPNTKLLVNVEAQKVVDLPAAFTGGIEYTPHPMVAVRTGFNTLTEAFNFGVGGKARGFQLDYALGSQSRLGLSHVVALAYTFGITETAATK
jgi:hypothetical protein